MDEEIQPPETGPNIASHYGETDHYRWVEAVTVRAHLLCTFSRVWVWLFLRMPRILSDINTPLLALIILWANKGLVAKVCADEFLNKNNEKASISPFSEKPGAVFEIQKEYQASPLIPPRLPSSPNPPPAPVRVIGPASKHPPWPADSLHLFDDFTHISSIISPPPTPKSCVGILKNYIPLLP